MFIWDWELFEQRLAILKLLWTLECLTCDWCFQTVLWGCINVPYLMEIIAGTPRKWHESHDRDKKRNHLLQMTHRWIGKPALSTSEEESLQTFAFLPCNNSYITCGSGPVLLHHFAHHGVFQLRVVLQMGQDLQQTGLRPWAGVHLLAKNACWKLGSVVLGFSSLNRDTTVIKGGWNIAGKSHIK